jgi:hypothetical protein
MKKLIWLFVIFMLIFFVSCSKKEGSSGEKQVRIQMYVLPQVPFSDNLAELGKLGNVDFNDILENYKEYNPKKLDKIAFKLGSDIADALVCLKASNVDQLEKILTNFPDYGEVLGVSNEFLKLSALIRPLIDEKQWKQIELKLNLYQKKIINELYNLKSYDYVTMVQFGGWVKGLEDATFILNKYYNKEGTKVLFNKTLITALVHDVNAIRSDDIKKQKYMKKSIMNLNEIKQIISASDDGYFNKSDIADLHKLASEITSEFAKE